MILFRYSTSFSTWISIQAMYMLILPTIINRLIYPRQHIHLSAKHTLTYPPKAIGYIWQIEAMLFVRHIISFKRQRVEVIYSCSSSVCWTILFEFHLYWKKAAHICSGDCKYLAYYPVQITEIIASIFRPYLLYYINTLFHKLKPY